MDYYKTGYEANLEQISTIIWRIAELISGANQNDKGKLVSKYGNYLIKPSVNKMNLLSLLFIKWLK